MQDRERQLHRQDMADIFIATAERFEHSAIFMHPNPGTEDEFFRLIDLIRDRSGDRYFLAELYVSSLKRRPDLVVIQGATDVMHDRAIQFASKHGGKAYPSTEALLAADPEIDLVINLTVQPIDYEVTKKAKAWGMR